MRYQILKVTGKGCLCSPGTLFWGHGSHGRTIRLVKRTRKKYHQRIPLTELFDIPLVILLPYINCRASQSIVLSWVALVEPA